MLTECGLRTCETWERVYRLCRSCMECLFTVTVTDWLQRCALD